MEIRKGMSGLKQAGRIANERLTKHLQNYFRAPCPRTPALWRHNTLPIVFILVVDDFGVKYTSKNKPTTSSKHFARFIPSLLIRHGTSILG